MKNINILLFYYGVIILIITEYRAPDQDQSLILSCTNKEVDNSWVFSLSQQDKYMVWRKRSHKEQALHRTTACVSERTNIKDISIWIYLSN